MPPNRYFLIILLICIFTGLNAVAATPVEVDNSLQKATQFLMDQEKNGNWEETPTANADVRGVDISGGQWSGTTALATYALLCAHVSSSDPHLVSAIEFLTRTQSQGTYALGCRCLVWSALELNPATKGAATRDMKQLLNNMRSKGPALGMYFYLPPLGKNVPRVQSFNGLPSAPDDSEYDHSVSQFAALGLWALARQGFEVPTEAWRLMDQGWRSHQEPNGGWGYVYRAVGSHGKVTPSMTSAGVATLLITEEMLHPQAECKGNMIDPAIDAGIKCLADSFDGITDVENFMDGRIETHYTMFGISRIGAASGKKYFGKLDWYKKGTDLLIPTQQPDGSWDGAHKANVETALSILFLTYGGAPVVVNKLDYTPAFAKPPTVPTAVHWNQRPQDMLNFATWMGKQTEQRLNWQAVTLASTPQELHEAPVLLLSGNEALALSPADKTKLRQFVEDGGLILGNADCVNTTFSKSFTKLGQEIFPGNEFRNLPDDHPIFTNEQYPAKKWKPRPQLSSISNGVRELMMIPSVDLSQQFQLRNISTHAEMYQMADDIVLYAMDKQGLRKRGNTYLVAQDPAVPTTKEVKLVRLQHAGRWDPEPGGWRRFAAVLHNQDKIKLTVSVAKVGGGELTGAKLAHLTGTESFKFTPAQLDELKTFITQGGTLVIDAAGGSQTFASSAAELITQLFGDDGSNGIASPLPPDADLYKGSGTPLTEFNYRGFAKSRVIGSLRAPRICGIKQNGRYVCYFSREDLSAGLVGQPVDGIIGYDPATATQIMRAIVMSVAQ